MKTMIATAIPDGLIGTKEAAEILGITPARVRALQRTYGFGQLVAGRYLFDRCQLIEFSKIRNRTGGPPRKVAS